MTKGKPHIDESDFRRYLNNEMTNAERNAFEKELQKNPFEAEALEGLEILSATELDQKLNDLKSHIKTPKRKKRTSYLAAAATIMLLVTAGVIWMQLNKQNPVPKMTENEVQPETKTEEPAEQLFKEKEEKSAPIINITKEKSVETEKKAVTPTHEVQRQKRAVAPKSTPKEQEKKVPIRKVEKVFEMESIAFEDDEMELDEDIILAAPTAKADSDLLSQKLNSVVQGTVVSANDQLPIPGVTIVERGTNKGVITDLDGQFQLPLKNDSNPVVVSFIGMETNEFHPNKDSSNIIQLKASELAMDEVVVVGYGTKQKKNLTGSVTVVNTEPRNSDATPINGYKTYYEYLEKNALLPDDYPEKKLVVKLQLELDANGNIDRITNANNANEEFYTKAKTLVENGSDWQPKYFNNRQVKSQVKLRIVFKKAEK